MEADALARFRTDDDASIANTIARCDKPDVLVRIAFQCTDHRRYVLRQAASTVTMLRGELGGLAAMLSPWPSRMETIEIWAGGDDDDTPTRDKVRARTIAILYAMVAMFFAQVLVWTELLGDAISTGVAKVAMTVLTILFIPVARFVWQWGMRRQLAYLDELSALEIVVAHLAKASARNPSRVPWALFFLHRAYSDLLPRDGKPDTFQWPDVPPARSGRRRWAATFDSYDPERDVCYYRVQLFRRRQQTAQFMVEVSAAFRTLEQAKRWGAVQKLLDPIVATGKTNTSFVGAITAAP